MSATAEKLNGQVAPLKRGFAGVRCPYCGQADTLAVVLHSLEMQCDNDECGECFSVADIRHILDQWAALAGWLEQAPRAEG